MKKFNQKNKLPFYILCTGIIISFVIGLQSYQSLQHKDHLKFDSISKKTIQNIQNRMDTYREVLYSGIGLFKASNNNVSREAWHRFVKELHLEKYYPGIQGVGYSTVLYEKDLEANKKQIRAEGFRNYEIYPQGKRDFYTSIIYLEPFDWRNQRAFGYDMYSNDVRRTAMKRAIETKLPSLTGKVRLVQENGQNEQAGFLLYLPLYKLNAPLNTIQERYEAIQGFVYSPFRANDFMLGVVNDSLDFVQLKVYDGSVINEENLLFNSNTNQHALQKFQYTVQIKFEGRVWSIDITALDSFVNGNNTIYALISSSVSLLITILIFLIFRRQNEILQLKDEALYGVSQGIIITDKNRNVIYTNKAFEEISGYSSEFMLGKNPSILQGENSNKKTIEEINEKLSSVKPFEAEILNYRQDGTPFWNRISITPMFDKHQHLERFVGIQEDITERKFQDQKVLFERNFLKNILDHTDAIIAVIDSQGRMIRLNKYGCDFVKYSAEEVASIPWFWKRFLPLDKQVAVTKIIENAQKGIIVKNFQNAWISANNEERIFDWSNTLVHKEDGTMDYLVTIGIDVTNNVMIQKLILEQKVEFETIFNYSKDGIAIIDLDSNFIKFNDAYQELLRCTKMELFQTSYWDFTALEDHERSKKMINKVIENGSIKNFEKTYVLKDGKRLKVNCSISLLPDEKRLLIVAKDVTEAKVLEEQARLASMGEMIGNIAHQWRQPLSVITTAASATKLEKELGILADSYLAENMDVIVKEANYLSKTIDDFKNYIKGTKEFSDCKVSDIINESLQLMHATLKNNFIDVVLDIQEDGTVLVNRGQILQSFINILNNAKDALLELKHNQDKYIFITLSKKSDRLLKLEICDNGNGIDEKIINRIYEPYFTTKHQSVGTGIGLNMTRQIIHDNHSLSLDTYNKEFVYNNQEYKGACFCIEFETI